MSGRPGGRVRRLERAAAPTALASLPVEALIDRMVDCLLAMPEDVAVRLLAPARAATAGTGAPLDIPRALAHRDRACLAAGLATAAEQGLWAQITAAAHSLGQAADAS